MLVIFSGAPPGFVLVERVLHDDLDLGTHLGEARVDLALDHVLRADREQGQDGDAPDEQDAQGRSAPREGEARLHARSGPRTAARRSRVASLRCGRSGPDTSRRTSRRRSEPHVDLGAPLVRRRAWCLADRGRRSPCRSLRSPPSRGSVAHPLAVDLEEALVRAGHRREPWDVLHHEGASAPFDALAEHRLAAPESERGGRDQRRSRDAPRPGRRRRSGRRGSRVRGRGRTSCRARACCPRRGPT